MKKVSLYHFGHTILGDVMYESIWTQTLELPHYSPLNGNIRVDVAVIGGGLAGLLCAHELQKAGVDCLVIEADRIGRGVTAGTTAKITSQHGFLYDKLMSTRGEEVARGYWLANEEALNQFRMLSEDISCDFEKQDNYIYMIEDREVLERELDALSRLNIPADFVTELPLPFATAGAVRLRNQARFHPLKFLAGIVPGLNIRERTRVLKIEKNRVITDRGTICAEKIIVATHFPILDRRGLYFLKMYQNRSYVLALEGAQRLEGMYLDGSGEGLSFRSQEDYLLLGGGSHRTGKAGGGWEPLTTFARAHYPGSREVARWAAQDCITLDGIPYIGRYSPGTPWLFVATGFNKWGMTSSMAAARILRSLILEGRSPYEDIFDPGRRMVGQQLAANMVESAMNLLTPTVPRCPHLGCALKWNPAEHSWDCPCHGSRFGEDGALLDNPSKKHMN